MKKVIVLRDVEDYSVLGTLLVDEEVSESEINRIIGNTMDNFGRSWSIENIIDDLVIYFGLEDLSFENVYL